MLARQSCSRRCVILNLSPFSELHDVRAAFVVSNFNPGCLDAIPGRVLIVMIYTSGKQIRFRQDCSISSCGTVRAGPGRVSDEKRRSEQDRFWRIYSMITFGTLNPDRSRDVRYPAHTL